MTPSLGDLFALFSLGLLHTARRLVRAHRDELLDAQEAYVPALDLRVSLVHILMLFGEVDMLHELQLRADGVAAPLRRADGAAFMTPHELAVYHMDEPLWLLLQSRSPDDHRPFVCFYASLDADAVLGKMSRGFALYDRIVSDIELGLRDRRASMSSKRSATINSARKIVDRMFPDADAAEQVDLFKRLMSPFTFVRLARDLSVAFTMVHSAALIPEFHQMTPRRRMRNVDQSERAHEGPRLNVSARINEDLGVVMFVSNPTIVRNADCDVSAVRVTVLPGARLAPYMIRSMMHMTSMHVPQDILALALSDPRAVYEQEYGADALYIDQINCV